MTIYKEKIVNLETGEETWRDFTQEEIAQVEAAKARAILEAEAQAEKEASKAAAEAKLAALGLTSADLKALGL